MFTPPRHVTRGALPATRALRWARDPRTDGGGGGGGEGAQLQKDEKALDSVKGTMLKRMDFLDLE